MKTKALLALVISALFAFTSCKKDNSSIPQNTFTNNVSQGTADGNGEYTITGHISSGVSLDKVTLTVQGQSEPFFIDETTAKNKNEYDYSYLVTGISANTTIVIDVYDQNGGKSTFQFVIMK